MKAITAETCEAGWLAGLEHLMGCPGRIEHNLMLEIAEPAKHSTADHRLRVTVDEFLTTHGAYPISTVAETIFPGAEYRRSGVHGVFTIYPETIYPAIKAPHEWGRYAYRLVRRDRADGSIFNPLEQTIAKLKSQIASGRQTHALYELPLCDMALDLTLYDLDKDGRRVRGLPCLSHLSFKLGEGSRLFLTALYRYHYYVERVLGNLIGLAALQGFICDQTGLVPGPLVCVSTFAKVDTGRWRIGEVQSLIQNARNGVIAPPSSVNA